ncbi:MAG: hypothetical protein AAB739_00075 [Patescibacteria group bacterium]
MSFVEEFKRLQLKQPRIALQFSQSENSDYTNYAFKNKNCYLVFGGHYNEDGLYGQYTYATKDCVDCDTTEKGELAYECTYCSNIYNCNYLFNCHTCSDCEYGFDLINCKNCFLCAGLRNNEYHIQNKPVPKEKYRMEVEKLKKAHSSDELSVELEKVRIAVPHIAFVQKNCEHSVGSYIQNCKNCFYCFNMTSCEDCSYLKRANEVKDSIDCDNIGYDPSELLYESIGINGGTNFNFCFACWHSSDLEYCELVFNSHHCFGCISRNHAEYEILNIKYEKEDWFKRVAEIKQELRQPNLYGKWLLPSTYPYEDTIAPLYF